MVLENQTVFKVAEVELVYKVDYDITTRPKVRCSSDSFNAFLSNWNMDRIAMQEEFKIMLLSTSNRVIGISTISQGGLASTVVDARFIFATALKGFASGIILAHNHPSGELTPSEHDIRATAKLVEAGKLLDIKVLDHLIVTTGSYYSFGDNGLL